MIFTIKAIVACRTNKEFFIKFLRRSKLLDDTGHINNTSSHGNGTTKSQNPVQMKTSDFGIVTLKVPMVKVVGPSLLEFKWIVR